MANRIKSNLVKNTTNKYYHSKSHKEVITNVASKFDLEEEVIFDIYNSVFSRFKLFFVNSDLKYRGIELSNTIRVVFSPNKFLFKHPFSSGYLKAKLYMIKYYNERYELFKTKYKNKLFKQLK